MSEENGKKAYIDETTLKKYLGTAKNNEILCREERQFALLLYNAFLEEKRHRGNDYTSGIVKKCLFGSEESNKVEIQDVYFEATLMRDYFDKSDKEEFNKKLLLFCMEDNGKVECLLQKVKDLLGQDKKNPLICDHLGQKTVKNIVDQLDRDGKLEIGEKARIGIARMMMNATPDILVAYKTKGNDKQLHVQALECKYLSDEGRYKDVAGAEVKMQFFVQECIMSFLFGKKELDDLDRLLVFPKKSRVWKDNESLGGEIYADYKNIITQEWESKDNVIINDGVVVILFERDERERDEGECVKQNFSFEDLPRTRKIKIEDLLEEMYYRKSGE